MLMMCYSLGTSATVETGPCCPNTPALTRKEAAVGKADGKRLYPLEKKMATHSSIIA